MLISSCFVYKLCFIFRWKVFAFMISPELDFKLLQSLPDPRFIYPVCQLYIMQHEWQVPVLFSWEVQLFLLQHLRFQEMTEKDFKAISRQSIQPNPRGIQLATLYTQGKVDLASKMAGKIVPIAHLLPLYTNFDGLAFQQMYSRYKAVGFIEATHQELNTISFYFDLVTNNGTCVRKEERLECPSFKNFMDLLRL